MKFAQALQAQSASMVPGSLQAVFPYKAFKKSIAAWTQRCDEATVGDSCVLHQRQTQLASCQRELLRMLSAQLQRLNATLVEHEEELVMRWHELQEQLQSAASAEQQLHADMAGVQVQQQEFLQQLVNFHGDAVMLLNWSQVNFSAVVKALKKFDKHMGTSLRMPLTQQILTQPFCCTEVITRLTSSAEQGVEQVTARMHQLSLALTSGTNAAAPAAATALAPVSATSDKATGAADVPAAMTAPSYDRLSAPSACLAFMRQSTGVSMSDCAYNRLSACPETTDFTRMSTEVDQAFTSASTTACNTFAPCQGVKSAGCIAAVPIPAGQPSAIAPTAACAGACTSADCTGGDAADHDAAEVGSMHMSEELLQLYDDIDYYEDEEYDECEDGAQLHGKACIEQQPQKDGLQAERTPALEVPAGSEAPDGWPGPAANPLVVCLGMSRRIWAALDTWGKLTNDASTPSTILSASAPLPSLSNMAGRRSVFRLPEAPLSAPLAVETKCTGSERSSGACSSGLSDHVHTPLSCISCQDM